ncbi:MAG: right-handed parallel beta-helix repeat-containing protein, partial [Methanomassiliicoccales archaeon]
MRRIKAELIVFMVFVGAVILSDVNFETMTMRANAATLYVGGSNPGNYSNIQDAITAAAADSTIYVYTGTYDENLFIDKTLTLMGENKYTTVINTTGHTYGIEVSNIDYVNISGFTVLGANACNIKLTSSNHSHIHGNILKEGGFFGLGLSSCYFNLIEENDITENLDGVTLSSSSKSNILRYNTITISNGKMIPDTRAIHIDTDSDDNLLLGNIISGHNISVYIKESLNCHMENNQISDCIEGLRMFDQSSGELKGNTISNAEVGVWILEDTSATLENCTIENIDTYSLRLGDEVWKDADVTLINTTFDTTKVNIIDDESSLMVNWYLHVKIVDEASRPVAGISVRVKDNPNGSFDEDYSSNSEGFVRWIVLAQFSQNRTGRVYFTPYNITVYNTSSLGYARPEVMMDKSKEITITTYSDSDGDGVFDINDAFPDEPTQW